MARQKANSDSEAVISGKDQLQSILNQNKDDHFNFHNRVDWKISTGSLLLDSATGGISPSLLRMCGANNEGKTPQTLEILRNFLTTVENSKALWVLAEGRGLSEENKQRCGLKFVYKPEEWEIGTIFVLESNVYELFINTVKTLVKENHEEIRYAFVVDSIDGLTLKADSEKEITENNKVAGTPSLSKKMLQSLSLGMFKFGHLMILISQVTAEIKLNQYEKTPNRGGQFSGGNSLLHASDYIFEFEPSFNGDFILDNPSGKMNDGKSKPIGKYAKVTIAKSMLEASKKQKIVYPIRFGRKPSGIWVEREIGDCLIAWNMLSKAGAWLTFKPDVVEELAKHKLEVPEKIQGLDKLYAFLEDRKDVCEYFYKQFKDLTTR